MASCSHRPISGCVLLLLLLVAALPDIGVAADPPKLRPDVSDLYGESWAVIIGIDKYQNAAALTYAVKDARSMERALKAHGFRTVYVLLNEKATAREIRKLLGDDLPGKVKPNDRVVVFFAGHGETRELASAGESQSDLTEMGYLIPVEGDLDSLHSSSISMHEIRDYARLINGKHVLFLLDACYGGLATRSAATPARRGDWVTELTRKKVRQIITAGGKNEKVIEVGGHGLFTKYLLQALETDEAVDNDGILTASGLATYVKKRVIEASRDLGRPHSPVYNSFSGDGDLIFIRPVSTAPPAPRPPIVAAPRPPAPAIEPAVITRPPRVEPRAAVGVLEVRSSIQGLEVWIGNERLGETTTDGRPLVADRLAPGTHRVRALKSGYKDVEREITVAANDTARVELTPERVRRQRFPRDHGRTLLDEHRWAEAEAAFRDAVEREPGNARWHAYLGIALARQDRWREAEEPFRSAVKLETRNPVWRMNLGLALELQRQWAEAETVYRQALRLEPRVARWQSQLGDVLNAQQKWPEAAEAFKQAVSLEPHTARYHAELAVALAKQERWPEAEIYSRQAVRQEPKKALWHARLGEALRSQDKWKDAAAAFQEALRLEPDNSRYQERLAEATSKQP